MILVSLELENYRQYRAERIEFPERGIVGVVGANGVGKTTLFEAIEWALFAPREIGNQEVPPRGIPGATKATLRLFDPRDGATWVVERSLSKSGSKHAEVYREENPSQPVVQGSDATTKYIAGQLLGLSRPAFVSTFFTRQKELSFFGALRPTDRRREVSRLLGLDVIRTAQQMISEERNEADQHAKSLVREIERIEGVRDFAAEIAAALEEIAAQGAARDRAQVARADCSRGLDVVRDRLTGLRKLEARDNELRVALAELDGRVEAARAEQRAAADRLDDLDRKQQELVRLMPLAEREPALLDVVRQHDHERERAETAERLRRLVADLDRRITEAGGRIRAEVEAVPAGEEVPGWRWLAGDAADPATAAERLAEAASQVDADGAEAAARGAERCAALDRGRSERLATLRSYRDRFAIRERELAALLAHGHPAEAVAQQQRRREVAGQLLGAIGSKLGALSNQRDDLLGLRDRLRQQQLGEPCPTCGRAFTEDDLVVTVGALERQAVSLGQEIVAAQAEERDALARVADEDRALKAAEERLNELRVTESNLERGRGMIEGVEQQLATEERELAAALAAEGLVEPPTAAEVERLLLRATLLRDVRARGAVVATHGMTARRAAGERDQATSELQALGPIVYDPAAHRGAQQEYDAARQAVQDVARLAREVSERPAREAALEACAASLAGLGEERVRVAAERGELGFDPAVLRADEEQERQLRDEERLREREYHQAESALRQAVDREQRLRDEERHLSEQREVSVRIRREADDLSRMYGEFDAFERYVAGQLGPRIAETAGELIERVTSGKYTRVDLDENYGMRVFDGEEAFAVEQFSGGERDVFALCARLALSRVVGGQALNRPRFLVLDEVFGSLDQERRRQLLDVLCRLTQETEDFRQMFIISHVEDVIESELMDQLWRVGEVDGQSRIDIVTRGERAALGMLAEV